MASSQKTKYYEAVGRRKRAIARVRISESSRPAIEVNAQEYRLYFPTRELQAVVEGAGRTLSDLPLISVSAKIKGGGLMGQAEALRHGLARALVVFKEEFRSALKNEGLLTRDARVKERKKFGLRKARRAPQWSKR